MTGKTKSGKLTDTYIGDGYRPGTPTTSQDLPELHLEYHCDDCGSVDIHRRFKHVNTWSWIEKGLGGSRRVDLHV